MTIVNPDSVPLTTAEANELARATLELLERVAALESQLHAVASALDCSELVGDLPAVGRGTRYLVDRLAAVDEGRFGSKGVEAFLEKLNRDRRVDPLTVGQRLDADGNPLRPRGRLAESEHGRALDQLTGGGRR